MTSAVEHQNLERAVWESEAAGSAAHGRRARGLTVQSRDGSNPDLEWSAAVLFPFVA